MNSYMIGMAQAQLVKLFNISTEKKYNKPISSKCYDTWNCLCTAFHFTAFDVVGDYYRVII